MLLSSPPPDDDSVLALPHASGPETSILSTCLQEPDHIARLIEAGFTYSTWYLPAHGTIWKTLVELYTSDQPIELVSLITLLHARKQLENLGGAAGVTHIYTFAPTSAHFDHHMGIVVDRFKRRQAIMYGTKLIATCYQEDEDFQSMLLDPAADILTARFDAGAKGGAEAVADWADNFKRKKSGEAADVVPCGIEALDDLRGGIDSPGLTYVGAFPSTGKTALMIQVMCYRLRHIIENDLDEVVLIFSLEMTARQVITRAVIHLARLDTARKITDPHNEDLTQLDLERIAWALSILKDPRLRIIDQAGISISEIEARSKLEAKKKQINFIGVDYVQRVTGDGDGVEQRMMKISAGLQRMWKRHLCSVMGLSQLTETKEGETRLKYAEALEEDADLSVRIERQKNEDKVTGLWLTKDRHRGYRFHRLKCWFDKQKQCFFTPNG